jgi:hypothetical protein
MRQGLTPDTVGATERGHVIRLCMNEVMRTAK